jgi:hypothetical protein
VRRLALAVEREHVDRSTDPLSLFVIAVEGRDATLQEEEVEDRWLPELEVVKINPHSLVELKTTLDDTVREVRRLIHSHRLWLTCIHLESCCLVLLVESKQFPSQSPTPRRPPPPRVELGRDRTRHELLLVQAGRFPRNEIHRSTRSHLVSLPSPFLPPFIVEPG